MLSYKVLLTTEESVSSIIIGSSQEQQRNIVIAMVKLILKLNILSIAEIILWLDNQIFIVKNKNPLKS